MINKVYNMFLKEASKGKMPLLRGPPVKINLIMIIEINSKIKIHKKE